MKKMRDSLLPTLLMIVLLGSLGLGLKYLGFSEESSKIIAAFVLFVSIFVLWRSYRPIRRYLALRFAMAEIKADGSDTRVQAFRTQLGSVVGSPVKNNLAEAAGLIGEYGSFEDCETRLTEMLEKARIVKVLTNTGQSDFGKGTQFYRALASNTQVEVKVLLCSQESYFISKSWAESKGYSETQAEGWLRQVRSTQSDIQRLIENHHIDIKVRAHKLPFVWHLWIIDQTAFVSAWLERKKNFQSVPVFALEQSLSDQPNRLFEMYDRYFDRLWDEKSHEIK